MMPCLRQKSSTDRRKELSSFIEEFGDIMTRPCKRCKDSRRVCKAHVRSGKCQHCARAGYSDCDIRVTQSEWDRLRREHSRLFREMEQARSAAVAAQERVAAAQEEASKALSKEMRLRKQLDRLQEEEAEAIAVEERSIELQELDEWTLEPDALGGPDLALAPLTWTSVDGLPDDFWEIPETQPMATSS